MPHRLAQFAQLGGVEAGRAHQVDRGKRHHHHVVGRVQIVLDAVQQAQVAIQQRRILNRVEQLREVVAQQFLVSVEAGIRPQAAPVLAP
jgi:hypothetical protein